MRVIGYRGVSVVSHLIKFQTRSHYSHVAVELTDGAVIEAWQTGGVRRINDAFIDHSPKTVIDAYRVSAYFDETAVENYLYNCIGQKYDFSSVFRFITRRHAIDNTKKFCSELVELAFKEGGCQLLNGNPSEHSPRDTLLSPHLIFEETLLDPRLIHEGTQ